MDMGYGWIKFVWGSYLKLLGIQAVVSGLEHVPSGPKIIVANHPNATDGWNLPFLFKEKLNFLVEYDALQTRIVGRWMQLADSIPVIAGRGMEALHAAHERLLRGNSVVIFPEGKLTTTHQVTRSGTGVARLALAAQLPILPIGFYVPRQNLRILHGHAWDGRPTVGSWQTKGKCYIRIGQPISVSVERAHRESYRFFRRFTEEIMQSVAALANQAQQKAEMQ